MVVTYNYLIAIIVLIILNVLTLTQCVRGYLYNCKMEKEGGNNILWFFDDDMSMSYYIFSIVFALTIIADMIFITNLLVTHGSKTALIL